MVMAGIKIRVSNLLDLTEAEVAAAVEPFLAAEKIHWRAIQDRREAVSQAIGRAAAEICFPGLIVPSRASPDCKTIVIFPNKFKALELLSAPSLRPLA